MKIILCFFLFSYLLLAKTNVVGIDVRTWPERKINPAPNSLAISTADLKEELKEKEISKDQEIVIFCESGGRATRAKKVLEELGYKKVKNIGSWREWNRDYASKSNEE